MRLWLLFILIVPQWTYSQLTQDEVYNYEVGDVIESKYMTNTLPPVKYEHRTILTKDVNGSVITYTIKLRTKYDGPPPYPTFDASTETLVVNVGSPAQHFSPMYSCLPFVYTNEVGSCGENIYRKQSDADSTCFEPPIWISTLHEGFGGPYFYGNDASNPGWFIECYLLYANTQNTGTCGQEHIWWTEPVVPEPEEPEVELPVHIWDMTGRECNFKTNTILFYEYADGTIERVFVIE